MTSNEAPDFAGRALPDVDSYWRCYLARTAQLRAVRDGITEGLSDAAIADELGLSVVLMRELAESLDRGADSEAGAYELIVRAHVEGSPRQALVGQLSAWQYADEPGRVLNSCVQLRASASYKDWLQTKRSRRSRPDARRDGEPGR